MDDSIYFIGNTQATPTMYPRCKFICSWSYWSQGKDIHVSEVL